MSGQEATSASDIPPVVDGQSETGASSYLHTTQLLHTHKRTSPQHTLTHQGSSNNNYYELT